jgi:hypothetical protein
MTSLIKRFILFGVLACVIGLVLIWSGAHLFTGTSQWARAIVWLDSDIDDYKRFPARAIANATPRFDFQQPSIEMQRRYVPVFDPITYLKNGRYITQDFDFTRIKAIALCFLSLTGLTATENAEDATHEKEKYVHQNYGDCRDCSGVATDSGAYLVLRGIIHPEARFSFRLSHAGGAILCGSGRNRAAALGFLARQVTPKANKLGYSSGCHHAGWRRCDCPSLRPGNGRDRADRLAVGARSHRARWIFTVIDHHWPWRDTVGGRRVQVGSQPSILIVYFA